MINVSQLRRMEKLEETIHDLCEKGARDPGQYLNILQAINDGRRIEIIVSAVFLSPPEQFQGFLTYNQWLKRVRPEKAIPEEEVKAVEAKLPDLDSEALIFYCHKGDVVLTAKLAWEYICSYREKVWKSKSIQFNERYLRPAANEPARPKGFYIKKRPLEDAMAIGKRFERRPVIEVCQELGKDWGMGSEGLQFVGITHKHYPELMDGVKFPYIDLPGLAVAKDANSNFCYAPILRYYEGELRLNHCNIELCSSLYGSGSLQQC